MKSLQVNGYPEASDPGRISLSRILQLCIEQKVSLFTLAAKRSSRLKAGFAM